MTLKKFVLSRIKEKTVIDKKSTNIFIGFTDVFSEKAMAIFSKLICPKIIIASPPKSDTTIYPGILILSPILKFIEKRIQKRKSKIVIQAIIKAVFIRISKGSLIAY
jgi:hypothetical protein